MSKNQKPLALAGVMSYLTGGFVGSNGGGGGDIVSIPVRNRTANDRETLGDGADGGGPEVTGEDGSTATVMTKEALEKMQLNIRLGEMVNMAIRMRYPEGGSQAAGMTTIYQLSKDMERLHENLTIDPVRVTQVLKSTPDVFYDPNTASFCPFPTRARLVEDARRHANSYHIHRTPRCIARFCGSYARALQNGESLLVIEQILPHDVVVLKRRPSVAPSRETLYTMSLDKNSALFTIRNSFKESGHELRIRIMVHGRTDAIQYDESGDALADTTWETAAHQHLVNGMLYMDLVPLYQRNGASARPSPSGSGGGPPVDVTHLAHTSYHETDVL